MAGSSKYPPEFREFSIRIAREAPGARAEDCAFHPVPRPRRRHREGTPPLAWERSPGPRVAPAEQGSPERAECT